MAKTIQTTNDLQGVSLPSFLQMLEQERKSCTVTITATNGKTGSFLFRDGRLIDAGYGEKVGLEAAYALLSLKEPHFALNAPQDRMVRINQPLARILLQATSEHTISQNDNSKIFLDNAAMAATAKANPLIKRLITRILAIPMIKHYYLLNRQGKMILRSSPSRQLCNFTSYAVMSSLQLRKTLDAGGLESIRIVMEDDNTLLFLPGPGLIIALLLDGQDHIPEIISTINAASCASGKGGRKGKDHA